MTDSALIWGALTDITRKLFQVVYGAFLLSLGTVFVGVMGLYIWTLETRKAIQKR